MSDLTRETIPPEWLCPCCGQLYDVTPTGFLTCPKGLGKLLPAAKKTASRLSKLHKRLADERKAAAKGAG